MAITELHTGHSISFDSTSITQLGSLSYGTNAETLEGFSTGCPEIFFQGMLSQPIEFSFSTSQLQSVFVSMDESNFYTVCPGGITTIDYREVENCGIRFPRGMATHIKAAVGEALIVIDSLEASGDGEATVDGRIYPIFDGSNVPVIWTDGVVLPDPCHFDQVYVVGPYFVFGEALVNGVQRLRIDFNTELLRHSDRGDLWDSFIAIKSHAPVITVDAFQMDQIFAVPVSGRSIGGESPPDSARFFLRRMINLSDDTFDGRYQDGEARHIRFECLAALHHVSEASYSGPNEEVILTYNFHCVAPVEATAPMDVAVDVVIAPP